jgi:hypothetical protein
MPTFLRRMLSKKDVDASVALHVRDLCGSVGKFEDLLRNGKDEDEVIGVFLEVARRTRVGDGELATKQMVVTTEKVGVCSAVIPFGET